MSQISSERFFIRLSQKKSRSSFRYPHSENSHLLYGRRGNRFRFLLSGSIALKERLKSRCGSGGSGAPPRRRGAFDQISLEGIVSAFRLAGSVAAFRLAEMDVYSRSSGSTRELSVVPILSQRTAFSSGWTSSENLEESLSPGKESHTCGYQGLIR